MCLFGIALGIHAYRFSQARTFRQLIQWLALSRPSERGDWETASWNSLRLAVIVFFAVSVLLYEIRYIISSDPGNTEKFLGLHQSADVEGTASETIFRYAVGWVDKKGKVPWFLVRTLDEAIALVRNKAVKYAFAFETISAAILRRDNLCDVISARPMVKNKFGGWYYGASIPLILRQKIDEALITLVFEDLPRKSVKFLGRSLLDCRKSTDELDDRILVLILLLTVGPILLKHLASLILSCFWSDLENPNITSKMAPEIESEADSDECHVQESGSN